PSVLRAMRRPGRQERTLERIRRWREICPELALRSTFIVGFPGESDEDFAGLLEWLQEAKLDRVGAFRYEPVKGAAANDLGLAEVAPETKDRRYRRLMEKQQIISAARLKRKVGSRLLAIVDSVDGLSAKGRTRADAPEIDGAVHILSKRPLRSGDIVTVKIERSDAYDLFGSAA
ncbi:MAG TPA: radical SAM protein, partial [Beijerinckiaceae bacterium]|nr:radical SAM protein [Beijerinckiaceae bacterium]